MIDNKQAHALLQKSLFSYLFEIIWRGVAFTAVFSAIDYFFRPKAFTFEDVVINLVSFIVLFSLGTFVGLLMAAARYRKRPKNWDDDV